jgi:ribosomal-protein-alanine N-acetyltransferase
VKVLSVLAIALNEATRDDLPALVEIDAASSRTPWSHALFQGEIEAAVSRVLVARRLHGRRDVVGFICWSAVAGEAEIRNLAVQSRKRRCGVGRALVRAVLEQASAHGAETVYLEVREANDAARRLYASFGFETTGMRADYYGRDDHGLRMALRLASDDGTPAGSGRARPTG